MNVPPATCACCKHGGAPIGHVPHLTSRLPYLTACHAVPAESISRACSTTLGAEGSTRGARRGAGTSPLPSRGSPAPGARAAVEA